jgi:hypothetical protein
MDVSPSDVLYLCTAKPLISHVIVVVVVVVCHLSPITACMYGPGTAC